MEKGNAKEPAPARDFSRGGEIYRDHSHWELGKRGEKRDGEKGAARVGGNG